jgi:hypothetical protein
MIPVLAWLNDVCGAWCKLVQLLFSCVSNPNPDRGRQRRASQLELAYAHLPGDSVSSSRETSGVKATSESHNTNAKAAFKKKLGWKQGVLIPCLLNIWGGIMLLRLGLVCFDRIAFRLISNLYRKCFSILFSRLFLTNLQYPGFRVCWSSGAGLCSCDWGWFFFATPVISNHPQSISPFSPLLYRL